MRRSSVSLFLFALALFGRLALPLAVHAQTIDPLSGAPLCLHAADGSPYAPDSHHDALPCDQTCCHIAQVLVADPPVFVPGQVEWALAEWRLPHVSHHLWAPASSHRARAPPHFS